LVSDRGEHRLRVSEKRVLRRICGLKDRQVGRPKYRWQNKIKIKLTENEWNGMY
jgi:hypothetical protein